MSSAIKNRHTNHITAVVSPITGAFAITPNDGTDLQEITLSLFVGTAGAVKVTLFDGTTVTYSSLAAGRHPLRVKRLWATGTAATNLIGEV